MGKRGRLSISTPDMVLEKSRNVACQLLSAQDELVISKVVSILSTDPAKASRVLLLLETGQLEAKPAAPADRCHSQNKLCLIPRGHMVAFMSQICPTLTEQLANFHGKPIDILALALNMDPGSAVFTKRVPTNLERTRARYEELGSWLNNIKKGSPLEKKNIGFFELIARTEDGVAPAAESVFTHVKHTSGSTAPLPAEMRTLRWKIEENQSFYKAALVHGVQTCKCVGTFKLAGVPLQEPLK